MKRHFFLTLFPLLLLGLLACGSAENAPAAEPISQPGTVTSSAEAEPIPTDAVFYSPVLQASDKTVTVFYHGTRAELPLAEDYLLHGKEGDAPRGAISQNSLFEVKLAGGTVTELTWLVGAQGWRSVVSDNYTVVELETLQSGSRKLSVVNDKGVYISGILLPADVTPVDENGACEVAYGDVIRTAVPKEPTDGKNTAPVLYVTKHANLDETAKTCTKDADLWDALSEVQKATRTKVVDYMTAMAELEWTPSERIYYDDFGGASEAEIKAAGFTGTPYYAGYRTKYEFAAGTVYHGLPYTHQFGNYERMAQFIDEKGVLRVENIPDDFGTKKDGEAVSDWNGWMGWDCYLGTDCSGSVYSAWSQVSPVQFDSTGRELPTDENGISFVGDVQAHGKTTPKEIVAENDAQTMYEAYAKALPGDAMLYNGHTLLVASSAAVYRNADGTVNPFLSYLLITDIQRTVRSTYTSSDGKTYTNTQWRVRRKVPFISLYTFNGGCVMLTNDALQNGNSDLGRVSLTVDGLFSGKVISEDGYRILFVTASVSDSETQLWQTKEFCVGADRTENRYHRFIRTAYDLSELRPAWEKSGVKLESGKAYTFSVTAHLSTGAEETASIAVKG